MLQQPIEAKWIGCFVQAFALCGVKAGDTAAILSETQSRPVNVHLAQLDGGWGMNPKARWVILIYRCAGAPSRWMAKPWWMRASFAAS